MYFYEQNIQSLFQDKIYHDATQGTVRQHTVLCTGPNADDPYVGILVSVVLPDSRFVDLKQTLKSKYIK